MRYRNVRTGNIIDINSELKDKEWELVETPAPPEETKIDSTPVKKRTKKK